MKGYQAGIKQFYGNDSIVFGISTDDLETNTRFAKELELEFALLSDATGEAAKAFGVLNERNMANRTTFVVDATGKIAHVEEGSSAIDFAGAASACSRLKK
jgi:peroxiredoxin Q/BCP